MALGSTLICWFQVYVQCTLVVHVLLFLDTNVKENTTFVLWTPVFNGVIPYLENLHLEKSILGFSDEKIYIICNAMVSVEFIILEGQGHSRLNQTYIRT